MYQVCNTYHWKVFFCLWEIASVSWALHDIETKLLPKVCNFQTVARGGKWGICMPQKDSLDNKLFMCVFILVYAFKRQRKKKYALIPSFTPYTAVLYNWNMIYCFWLARNLRQPLNCSLRSYEILSNLLEGNCNELENVIATLLSWFTVVCTMWTRSFSSLKMWSL